MELLIGGFATALVTIVTGMLLAFGKFWSDRETAHLKALVAKDAECKEEKQGLENDLAKSRLYAAELETKNAALERNNDAWRDVASTLRDKCSMLQTTLNNLNVPIPDDRRNVTKPLDAMLVEHLEQQRKTK